MNPPRVTVLMSVYNSARYLESAMRSILDQTFTGYEFLIIDDGSKDESSAILDAATDPRIRVIRTENRGLAAALELGVREARGDYIARMDADDLAAPSRLAEQVQYLDDHPGIGVVDADHVQIDLENRPMPTFPDPTLRDPRTVSWKLMWQNVICHPLVMMRRDVLLPKGINYDPKIVIEDYDLWTRLIPHTKFGHISKDLLQYRRTPGGMTLTRGRSQFEAMSRVYQRTFAELLGHEIGTVEARTLTLLSQQTSYTGEPDEATASASTLIDLAMEIRKAYGTRAGPASSDPDPIDRDLALRLLDWAFTLARRPRRGAETTGPLFRQALRLDPTALLDRRAWRNALARLIGPERYLALRAGKG